MQSKGKHIMKTCSSPYVFPFLLSFPILQLGDSLELASSTFSLPLYTKSRNQNCWWKNPYSFHPSLQQTFLDNSGLKWSISNVGWKLPNNYIKQTFSLQSCYFVDFTTHQSNKYIIRTFLLYLRSMPAFSSTVVGCKACKTSVRRNRALD